MGKAVLAVLALLLIANDAYANCLQPTTSSSPPTDKKKFIEWIKPIAADIQRKTGIPSSVLIGQAIYESGWGQSRNTRQQGNLFGIKCMRDGFEFDYKQYTAGCGRNGYATFPDAKTSIYAYAYKLSKGTIRGMPNVYSEIRNSIKSNKRTADIRNEVLENIGEWKTGNKTRSADYIGYGKYVQGIIKSNGLTATEDEYVCGTEPGRQYASTPSSQQAALRPAPASIR